MQKITPSFLFDDAEAAVRFYVSIFKEAEVTSSIPGPDGKPVGMTFTLDGVEFLAINGGPSTEFTMATSFMIHCDSQEEVDYFWERLGEGGEYFSCGWLKDKFGVHWQVTPSLFGKLIGAGTPEQGASVMAAMFEMTKFDIAGLQRAFDSVKK